eukprot:1630786-Prymnesium_polylepis.1
MRQHGHGLDPPSRQGARRRHRAVDAAVCWTPRVPGATRARKRPLVSAQPRALPRGAAPPRSRAVAHGLPAAQARMGAGRALCGCPGRAVRRVGRPDHAACDRDALPRNLTTTGQVGNVACCGERSHPPTRMRKK